MPEPPKINTDLIYRLPALNTPVRVKVEFELCGKFMGCEEPLDKFPNKLSFDCGQLVVTLVVPYYSQDIHQEIIARAEKRISMFLRSWGGSV